ncbi:MAG: mechanosensitive ion channel family protein [Gemmatimonadetes bacterium]|nr:mechanosensitive ion channel family protein [Gemmatimonadota bacterium]
MVVFAAPSPLAAPIEWGPILERALPVVGIVLLGWIGLRAIGCFGGRWERALRDQPGMPADRVQRRLTLARVLRSVARVAVIVLAALTILNLFLPIGPLLAGIGILGLAFSFGAQSLVRDLIAGIFILVEGQFGIGDVVQIGDAVGQVEKMTLRVTVLRSFDGTAHIIPNGNIDRVANLTKEWARAVVDVGVGYREDIDRVVAVLRDCLAEFAQDPAWQPLVLEAPQVLGVEAFSDSAVVLRAAVKTRAAQRRDVERELRRRIKRRFDEEGIEIPFPTRTLVWASGERPAEPAPEATTRPAAASQVVHRPAT